MLKPEQEILDIIQNKSNIKPEAYLEMAVKTKEFVKDNSTMSPAEVGYVSDVIENIIDERITNGDIEKAGKKGFFTIDSKVIFDDLQGIKDSKISTSSEVVGILRQKADAISAELTKRYKEADEKWSHVTVENGVAGRVKIVVNMRADGPINEAFEKAYDPCQEASKLLKEKKINLRTLFAEVFPNEDLGAFEVSGEISRTGFNTFNEILDEMSNGNQNKKNKLAEKIIAYAKTKPVGYKILRKDGVPINEAVTTEQQQAIKNLEDILIESLIDCTDNVAGDQIDQIANRIAVEMVDLGQTFLDEVGEQAGDVEYCTECVDQLFKKIGQLLQKAKFGADV